MEGSFRIGITNDFFNPKTGEPFVGFDALRDLSGIEFEIMPELKAVISPDQIRDYDGVISMGPRWSRGSFEGVERLTVIGRMGVGYDNFDLEACTDANVMLAITPDSIRRTVAVSILTLVLALTRQLLIKDQLTRQGRFSERMNHNSIELDGKTLGSIGLGNIGREVFRLFKPLDLGRCIAYDPYASPASAAEVGVELVGLEAVLRESDILTVNCPLNPQTHHLVGERELAMMKPTAYFVNTARGGIVDQAALTRALRENRIGGAGLDVFEQEPIAPDDPLLGLPNVVLAPHALGNSLRSLELGAEINCRSMLQVARGEVPANVVNKRVLEQPGLKAKLARYAQRAQATRE